MLHRVVLDRPTPLRPLYWRVLPGGMASPVPHLDGHGGLHLAAGVGVSFETYGNGLFEHQWRLYTRAGAWTLALDVGGRAALRVWRRTPDTGTTMLYETEVSGAARVTLPQDTPHFRQAGLLWFDLLALDDSVLHHAAWSTPDAGQAPARLGVVICTFDRPELAGVLAAIASDNGLDNVVTRVVVVNQGRPGLLRQDSVAPSAARLGARLHIVEQANLGGAGGFSRGLLEVLDDRDVTHCCFLDDDVRLEPESLRRMAAFFTLAKADCALGGHMLDSVRPTTLYEAGAVVADDWMLTPLHHGRDLADPNALQALLDAQPMHYNGWWMCGFPKRLVDRVGMPLPCFIRGEDVEFGLRLHEAGIPTVGLPGVAIWHEPFYLKIGGWQLYYETRNALVCAALHQDFSPNWVGLLMLKRLLVQLLTHRYYSAALIVRGIEDFMRGPAVLDADPRPLHASLSALRQRFPDTWTNRDRVLSPWPVRGSPRTRAGFTWAMLRSLAHNWVSPTRDAPPRRLAVWDLVWFRVLGSEHLAVDTHWDRELRTHRRDRESFRSVLSGGVRAIWRLRAEASVLRQGWREAAPRLTSVRFWQAYVRHGAPESPVPVEG